MWFFCFYLNVIATFHRLRSVPHCLFCL